MATEKATLNYGVYCVDKYDRILRQVYDGTEQARYATFEEAQQALPRLQSADDALAAAGWGKKETLRIAGRTW